MNRFYTLLFTLLFATALQAQQINVSGIVKSGNETLPGVAISVKNNPSQGTMTDGDGVFEIAVDGNSTLIITYIGFEKQEIAVNNRKTININLLESDYMLDEIIIQVPYGTAKKSTFTGSAGIVDGSIIEKSQVSNVTKALQGTVAGVQSFSMSGQPGSDATIRIRGIGSVIASSDPLYVVDGVPYDGALSSISSADIESITVMKDAASATLYGSRAANGVVMITTKQGNKDATPTIEITSKFGISQRARKDYTQMSTNDNFELYWEAMRNARYDSKIKAGLNSAEVLAEANEYASRNIVGNIGINPYGINNVEPIGYDGKLKAGLRPLWNDDWVDALSQDAHYTDVNIRVSGGGKTNKYYVSGGYLNDQGIVLESGFKRYTLRANVTSDIRNWLQMGINVSGTHSIQDHPKQDDSAITNLILFARSLPGFYPIYERDRTTGAILNPRNYDFGSYRATSFAGYNLAATQPMDKNEITRDDASIRGYLQAEPIQDLTLRSSLNIDYDSRFNHTYGNPTYGKASNSTGGSSFKSNDRTTGLTFNNIVNYSKSFKEIHNIRVLAGQEYYQYRSSNMEGERNRMVTEGFYDPVAGAALKSFTGMSDSYNLLSFLGSAEYSLKNKYYLSGSVRSDASSRFHPDNRWGTFWSVGGSWRIIDEAFMEKYKSDWLSNLLLRSSYGAQGNDNINTYYAYQALFNIKSHMGESGLITDRLATPDLSWETNLNLNVGLDFGFFNNRLSGTIEFFERRSKDLLFERELAPSLGHAKVSENIGTVKNFGWEFLLEGYPIHTKDWKWKLSVNATTYQNKIVSLPGGKPIYSGTKKWVEGGSINDFYMIEWAGVNPENGDPQWYIYDQQGNKTVTNVFSNAQDKDRVKLGSSLPKLSGGFSSSLTFKDIEFSALFSYNLGGKIYDRDKTSLLSQGSAGRTWSTEMLDRWTPENTNTDIPRLTTSPQSSWIQTAAPYSSRFLIDRSYLRLKTVSLSYSLPKAWMNAISLKQASVFAQAENLLTFTKEQGVDPEQTFDGMTYYRYPAMKTISLGFNVKL